VPLGEPTDRVGAQPQPAGPGEDRVGAVTAALGEPGAQDGGGLTGERRGAVFPALTGAADVRACAEVKVGDAQAGDLGDPQAGLDGEQEQGVVSPSGAA